MKLLIIVAATGLILAGCATTTPEERTASAQGSCVGYGFQPGTDGFASCMMQMDLQAQETDYRRRQAIANGLQQMGQSMQNNRPVTCNTYGTANRGNFGATYGSSTTTCY